MSINRKLSKLANIIDDATQNQYLVADGSGELVFGDLTVSLIDGTNTTITKSTDPVTTLRFDTDSGFDLDDLGNGAVKIKMNSTFKTWEVPGQQDLVASGLDTIKIIPGSGLAITTNPSASPQEITFSSTLTDTDGLLEGSTNLYYTDSRVQSLLGSGNVLDIVVRDINARDVDISGNLTVQGTTTTVNQTTLTVNDSKIFLADGNNGDVIDSGVILNYNDGANKTAGMFRDATDGAFNFYHEYTPNVGTTLDTAHTSYSLAKIKADEFVGSLDWDNIYNKDDVTFTSVEVVDLLVTGTQTINNTTNVSTINPFILLNDNPSTNVDTGVVGKYDIGGTDYVGGYFRDVSDSGKFKFFEGSTQTFTDSSTVDVNAPGFTLATVVADTFEGSLDWSNITNAPSIPSFLNDLSDVDTNTTAPLDGQTIIWDAANSIFVPGDSFNQTDFDAAIALKSIDVLADVDTTSSAPASGDALVWNGTNWVPGNATANVTISTTAPSNPELGDVWLDEATLDMFVYYPDTNGNIWVQVNNLDTPTELNDLTDVDLVTNAPNNGEALVWDAANSVFVPQAPFSQTDFDTAFAAKDTDDLSEGTTNLYYTDARVNTFLASGNAGNIVTTGYIAGPANMTIDPAAVGDDTGTLIIAGNLTVQGTTTTVNSNVVEIGDSIITLNSDETGAPSQNGGIEIERGTSTNVQLRFNETSDKWEFTNDGTTYIELGTAGTFTGTTDDVTEGSTNLYFTDARADARADIRIAASSIDALADVDTTSSAASNGDALVWDGTNWVPQAPFSQTDFDTAFALKSVDDLSDVDITSTAPTTGDALVWDGSNFVPGNAVANVSISTTAPSNPEIGDVWLDEATLDMYIYYPDTNGNIWVQVNNLDTPTELNDLTDVDLVTTAPNNGEALVWDAANSVFVPGVTFSQTDFDNAISLKSIDVLSDVDTTSAAPTSGDALVWDGTNWVPQAPFSQSDFDTAFGNKSIDALSDVDTTSAAPSVGEVLQWDGSNFVPANVNALETLTTLSIGSNILSYVDEAGNTTNIDLSLYLDDTNLARLTSGSLNSSTGIATFTRDDASVFTVDFSSLINLNVDSIVTVSGGVFYIDGNAQETISLEPGRTYKFNQDDSSNSTHPLRFSTTENGTHGGGVEYTTGVTVIGTPGSSVSYTEITVTQSTPPLYYYCANHSGMGGKVAVGNAFNTDELVEGSTNLYYTDARADARIAAASIGDLSDVDLITTAPTDNSVLVYDSTTGTFVSGFSSSVNLSSTVPSNPSEGDLWLNNNTMNLYVWYTDSDSSQWVHINPYSEAVRANIGATPPANPDNGDLWVDETNLDFYIYNGTAWAQLNQSNIPTEISDLTDVNAAGVLDGQVLVYDLATSTFIPGDAFSQADFDTAFGAKSIDALSDVDTTSATPNNGQALVWDGTNWAPGTVSAGNFTETTTTLTGDSVNQKLVYTDETGTANDIDLSWAVDDTNLARITSGTLDNATGIATFTRDDATTFTVDFSALFDDTNTYLSALAFDTGTGVLTGTLSDASTVTVDLDGRYLETLGSIDGHTDVDITTTAPTDGQALVWDAANSKFIPGDSFSQTDFDAAIALKSIDVLSDVDTTSAAPTSGDALVWDGTNWVPGNATANVTISATAPSNPELGDVWLDEATLDMYIYYPDTNGNIWVQVNNLDTPTELNDLTDVDLVTNAPSNGEALVWDAANSVFVPGVTFSQSDFDTAFTAKSTDDLSEGSTNLYYTDTRADARIAAASIDALSDVDTTSAAPAVGEVLRWDGTNFVPGSVNALETLTTLTADSVNQRLQYTDEAGTVNNIDLSWAVDDTNLARITSGTLDNATGIATFTRDDATTFTVDFSALFDDTNTYLSTLSFDTANGVLTATLNDATAITVDLDGRYLEDITAESIGSLSDVDITSTAPTDGQALIWDNANSVFVPGDSFSQADFDTAFGNKSIDALSDVDTTSVAPTSGDTLVWNGTNFVPGNAAANVTVSTTAPSNPEEGDLWYDEDYGDLFVYVTDGSGTSQWVAVVDSQLPAALTISSTPPANPNEGDLWVDEDDMQLYTYYVDVDSAQWVQITPEYAVAISTLSATQPTNGYEGELWYDTTNSLMYVYDGTTWQQVGSAINNIGDLGDVDTTSVAPTNGQVLIWNSTTSLFEPGTIQGYSGTDFDTDFAAKTTDDLTEGTTNLYYTDARVNTFLSGGTAGNIITTGYLAGPATFTIDPAGIGDNTGTVVIAGNLQVDGTTTTINSTTVEVDDLNIVLGTGSINAAAANTGGITLDLGTDGSATIQYSSVTDTWNLNKGLNLGTNNITNIGTDGYALPTLDGTNRQVIMTDGSGTLTFEDLDTIHTEAVNGTTSTLLKGTPVYQTGTSGNAMTVAPADASDPAKMPAVGVLEQTLDPGVTGFVIHMGQITGVDTSAFNEGDTIYVAVGGGYTNVAPTGEGNLLQNLGRVTKVHATNGAGVVMGAGRSNAVPNLNDGNIFIGNASNQAVTASFATTLTTGLGNNSIDALSDVDTTSTVPTSGDALVWDGTNFVPQAPFSQTDFDTAFALKSIDGLADVDTTTTAPVSGDTLVWDGTNFVPGNSVANLTISTTAPSNPDLGDMWLDEATLDMFVYYPDTNGNIWVQVNNLDTPTELNDLTDVDLVTNAPTDGEALVWDAASSTFVPGVTFSQADFDTAFALKSIDALADVDTTSAAPSTGDALVWDGSNFVPQAPFSQTDFDTAFAAKDTDDLTEGTTNLYYTNARADARVNLQTGANLDLSNKSTTDLAEGTNLYYTDARVDSYVSGGTLSNIVTTGYLRGPASFTIDPAGHGDNTGTVVIAGNLQVDGNTTTINSTVLNVDDKNLELANGSTSAANSNGGGITLQLGTDGLATILYNSATDTWDFNKAISGTIDDISNHSIDALSDVDTTSNAPSTGDTLVWNGTNFVPGNATANLTISTTAPLSPELGDMWLDETTLDMFVYYPDTNGNIWVQVNNLDTPTELNDLTDVDLVTNAPTDGQALIWDNANSVFVPGDSFSQADFDTAFALKSIDALSDVDTTSVAPTSGDTLVWNGSNFVPADPGGRITLSASTPSPAITGDIWVDDATLDTYVYDGSAWAQINQSNIPTEISDLVDVDATGVANGQTLVYNTTTSQFEPGNAFSQTDFDTAFALKSIGALSDVDITTTAPTDGQTLVWDNANSEFVPGTIQGYASSDFDTDFAAKTTTDLTEGTNLYYTDARVDTYVSGGTLSNIVTTGYLRGPASFVIDPAAHGDDTGTVVIAGNLQVDGTTTTINSTTLTVDDLNITLGSGATNAAASNTGGITLDLGTDGTASISYASATDTWNFNKDIIANVTGNVTGTVSDISNHSIDALSDVDITSTAPTTGDALVWNGTNFVPGDATANVTISTSAPSNPSLGDVWLDEATLDMYIYYPDTNGNIWVQVNNLDTPTELNDLTDVDLVTTTPTDGQALVWDAANSVFVPGDSFSQTDFDNAFALKSISALSDVDTTSVAPTDGQTLIWDNANSVWEPGTITGYTDADVTSHLAVFDGSIIPDTNVTYDLGSSTYAWKDVYIGPGSLYMNNTQVLSEDVITSGVKLAGDTNQHVHIVTHGTGETTLETSDAMILTAHNSADITLNTSNGHIVLNGNVIMQGKFVTEYPVVTVTGGVFAIDGASQVTLSLEPGRTYRFDQSDATNTTHPFRFSTTSDGTHNSGANYTTGVTEVGTPGTAGAYTEIVVDQATPALYYYCGNHSGMGANVAVGNITSVNDLIDVDITSTAPTDGQALVWDNATNKFVPGDSFSQTDFDTAFNLKSIGDLSDVDITGAADNSVLVWDAASSTYIPGFSSSVNLSSTVPSTPSEGDLWLNNNTMNLYVWYTDSDSSQWVHINPYSEAVRANIGATPPANPDNGDLWVDESNLDFYIYNGTAWAQLNQSNIPSELSDLIDVNAAGAVDGETLVWDSAQGMFVPGASFSQSDFDSAIAAVSIDDLTDVDTTTTAPTDGQSLIWDSANSKFVPGDSFSQTDFDTAYAAKIAADTTFGANVIVTGDLTVNGTTTTINTTTLDVEDLNITVANGAADAAAANGAGLTADLGTDGTATITYNNTTDTWDFNKTIGGTINDISNHSIGGLSDVDITTTAPSSNHQILKWNGSEFVIGDITVIGAVAPTNPDTGQLWFDTADQYNLTMKIWDGSVWQIAGGGSGAVEVSTNAPSGPRDGDLWIEDTTMNLYVYYEDVDSGQWIQLNNNPSLASQGIRANVELGSTAPFSNLQPGDLWYNTDDGSMYVYYEDVDTSQWVQVVNPFGNPGIFELDGIVDGTANQVLTTDGAGNVSFQDVPRDVSELTDTTSLLDINLHLRTTGADLIKASNASSHVLELNRTVDTGEIIQLKSLGVQQGSINIDASNNIVIEADNQDIILVGTEIQTNSAIRFNAGAGNTFMHVEGTTDDANETSFVVTEPTADRTITFKDESGTVALVSDIPTDLTDLGIADGTINQVLKTDGNGNFSFQNAASKPIATAGDTAPTVGDEVAGDLWYNTTDGSLYVYYQDADSLQWAQVVNPFAQLNLFDLEDITDGTNLQVLTTDGAGNATFQDVPRDVADLTDGTSLLDINLHLRTTGADLIKSAVNSSHLLELNRTGVTGDVIKIDFNGTQQATIGTNNTNDFVITSDLGNIELLANNTTVLTINDTETVINAPLKFSSTAGNTFLSVEGTVDDTKAISFTVTEPTFNRTVTFKDEDGTVALTSDIPTTLTDLGIADGTINQVLKTDGNGNFSFQNAASKAIATAGDTAPNVGDEVAGDLWYNTTDGSLYVYYQDADSIEWIQVVNPFAQLNLFDLEDITDGTANQVLTTDGAGNATFQDVPRDVSDLTDTTSLLDINLHLSTTGADLIKATADQSHVLELNRTTDTGEIIQIKAAGVQQGNISLDSNNNLVLQSTSNAIRLVGTQVETDSTIRFSSTVGNTIIEVEGTTDDAFETSIVVTEPTADRTITFKDESGTVALVSDIPTTLTDIGITDGTLNQILSTDGAGNFSFVNNAGISMQFSDTAPSIVGRQPGDLWYHTNDGSMYVLYEDIDTTQWVQIINPSANGWTELPGSTTLPAAGGNYFIDTSSAAVTVTLPLNPVMGTKVHLIDGSGNAATNNITVARNGELIEGVADDIVMDYNRATLHLVYYNAANGWVLTES